MFLCCALPYVSYVVCNLCCVLQVVLYVVLCITSVVATWESAGHHKVGLLPRDGGNGNIWEIRSM